MHLEHKSNKIFWLLQFSVILILLLSNLTIKSLVPSFAANVFALVLIALIQFYLGLRFGMVFFITQLLILSNFTYGDNQCGLYNLTTFIALVLLISRSHNWRLSTKTKNFRLLVIFFFINALGYLLHPVEIVGILQGLVTFSCFIMIFMIVSEADFGLNDIGFIFKGLMIVQAYSLLINILKLLKIYDASLPMFGGVARIGSATQAGVMGNSELFAELNLIILIFITVVILSDVLRRRFSFSNLQLLFFFFISLANVILSRSRSVIILFILSLLYIILKLKSLIINRQTIRNSFILIGSTLLFFILFGAIINTKYSVLKFEKIKGFKLNKEQVISGYGLNRSDVFPMALARMKDQPWVIGYGWGNTERNRIAWGISNMPKVADFHNLFYSIPMIFGWIGLFIIVLLMLKTAFKLFIFKDDKLSYEDLILRRTIFFLMLIVLIVDQFKISAMRDPNYFMLFWIFLGISNSLSESKLSE